MNDADFKSTLADAVGEDYASDWAGQVGLGWMQESLTGATTLGAYNYTFVYDMAEDGDLTDALDPITGAGDAEIPVDGWYVSNGFYGWGWE